LCARSHDGTVVADYRMGPLRDAQAQVIGGDRQALETGAL
jgi:hypothetical protein